MGDDVTLRCPVGGDPTPRFLWTKEDGRIMKGRVKIKDGVLKIHRVVPSDEGVYFCQAENAVGEISASLSLSVYGKFTFETHE